jgi:hypothetical protein
MMTSRLVRRLERFRKTWLANPEAQYDFAKLIDHANKIERGGEAFAALRSWIKEHERAARSLGILRDKS